ncbi:MAG: PIN domain-containing protein [Oscillospiraceae bacterium]|nr:PIN domain-containing protein [Oscillospiraceae bacterium]
MKILADSNVFIDFWKNPNQKIIDTFAEEDVVICGVVKSELLHGARSDTDLNKISDLLSEFEELNFEESDWEKLGEQLYKLRTKGITVPFQMI